MLKVNRKIYEGIIEHAKEVFPVEACGYMAGSGEVITEFFKMTNVDNSPEHFSFDPKEQFAIYKKARELGLKIIGVYHSHPYTPARMSDEDLRLAYDENLLYAIVSLAEKEPVFKIFKVVEKKPEEVEYKFVE